MVHRLRLPVGLYFCSIFQPCKLAFHSSCDGCWCYGSLLPCSGSVLPRLRSRVFVFSHAGINLHLRVASSSWSQFSARLSSALQLVSLCFAVAHESHVRLGKMFGSYLSSALIPKKLFLSRMRKCSIFLPKIFCWWT